MVEVVIKGAVTTAVGAITVLRPAGSGTLVAYRDTAGSICSTQLHALARLLQKPPGHKAHAAPTTLHGNQAPDSFPVSTADTLLVNKNPWAFERMHASSVSRAMQAIEETSHAWPWEEPHAQPGGASSHPVVGQIISTHAFEVGTGGRSPPHSLY